MWMCKIGLELNLCLTHHLSQYFSIQIAEKELMHAAVKRLFFHLGEGQLFVICQAFISGWELM